MSKGALGIVQMSHKRAHHLYFLTRIKLTQRKIPLWKRTTHIRPQR